MPPPQTNFLPVCHICTKSC